MPTSSKPIAPWLYGLFATWLISVFISGYYFISIRLVEFDPDRHLPTDDTQLVQATAQAMRVDVNALSNSIVHFSQPNCSCTSYSQAHISSLNDTAKQNGFTIIQKTIDAATGQIIPSTPAIMIIGNNAELVYFGPYSTGLACSATNSIVDITLQNYQQGFASHLINNEALGCYCKN